MDFDDEKGPVAGGSDVPAVPPDALELDYVYEALAASRRRYVCYTLLGNEAVSLPELADWVAARERPDDPQPPAASHRDRVYMSLYHVHVPKLVDDDVVAFDDATERVTHAERTPTVLRALEGLAGQLDADGRADG